MPSELTLRHRDFLRTFAIFKDFHPNELLLLAQTMGEVRLEQNQVVFEEGDPGHSAYLVVFGTVGVMKRLPGGRFEPLAKLKSGQMFGQVSLIDGQPRSATCVATSRALLLELRKDLLDQMFLKGETLAFKLQDYLTRVMVRQVRQADEKLATLVSTAREKSAAKRMDRVFDTMTDAMRSAEEMGVDLDEVEHVIFEGQKRDFARKREENQGEAMPQEEAKHPARRLSREAEERSRLKQREKVTREISEIRETELPSLGQTREIAMDDIDFPSLSADPIRSDGTYSVSRKRD